MSESMGVVPFDPIAEAQVQRWTSDGVLIDGAKAGWADPEDPRKVDFTEKDRQSVRGPLQFDDDGYPLRPDRTPLDPSRPNDPDQMGGRGELGKHGVGKAEDQVTITIDEKGQLYLLLGFRKLSKEARQDLNEEEREKRERWALPGGIRAKGEKVGAAAGRETLEEAGVDARNEPKRFLLEDIMDDPRNTRNSWIESRAYLVVLRHTPKPQADPGEMADVRWFPLTTLEALEKETGPLYASHGAIVEVAIQTLNSYKKRMDEAQTLHGAGNFPQAVKAWEEAIEVLPDHFSKGRAYRGLAASLDRIPGQSGNAEIHAQTALNLHEGMFTHDSHNRRPDMLRERGESRAVLGRLMLRRALRGESSLWLRRPRRDEGTQALGHLQSAFDDLTRSELVTGAIDQHKINLLSRLSIAESLFGHLFDGKSYAWSAIDLAQYSEAACVPNPSYFYPSSKSIKLVPNPYPANLDPDAVQAAQRRAKIRGYSALVVNRLISSSITGGRFVARRLALSKAGL